MAKAKTPKVKTTKEKTPIEKEYDRLRSNLLAQRQRLLKEGFKFEKEIIPPKPKQIKEASIRNLQRVKASLLDKARIKTASGEILTGRQYRNVKRWESAKKGAETRKRKQEERKQEEQAKQTAQQTTKTTTTKQPKNSVGFADAVINNYMSELNKWEQSNNEKVRKNAGRVANWIESLLEENEKEKVAQMIEEGAQAGNILTFWVLYDKDLTDEYMTEMIRFFPGMTGQEREEMQKEVAEDEEGFMSVDFDEDEDLLFD